MKNSGRFSTPSSGRKWKSRRTEDDEMIPGVDEAAGAEDAAMIAGMFPEQRQGGGGGDGAGARSGNDGSHNYKIQMLEEQMSQMETSVKHMKGMMQQMKEEIEELKKDKNNKVEENQQEGQPKDWKAWGGEWKEQNAWNEDRAGGHQFGMSGWDNQGHRVWGEDRRIDRKNEMVARGFERNTKWTIIKDAVEKVMNKSGVTFHRVQVIGQKNSFAFIKFETYEHKQGFKRWLEQWGDGVKEERGIWFGDNLDKDASERARAVGKVKKALMLAKNGRSDVDRCFDQGKVWVGRELVARWDDESKRMQFRGEGKQVKEQYEKLLMERRGEEEVFSD